MQLEPGRLDIGFNVFNHGDFDIDDFRVARAYATGREFRFRREDSVNAIIYSAHPNRDRDLHMANNVVSEAIAQAMQ